MNNFSTGHPFTRRTIDPPPGGTWHRFSSPTNLGGVSNGVFFPNHFFRFEFFFGSFFFNPFFFSGFFPAPIFPVFVSPFFNPFFFDPFFFDQFAFDPATHTSFHPGSAPGPEETSSFEEDPPVETNDESSNETPFLTDEAPDPRLDNSSSERPPPPEVTITFDGQVQPSPNDGQPLVIRSGFHTLTVLSGSH